MDSYVAMRPGFRDWARTYRFWHLLLLSRSASFLWQGLTCSWEYPLVGWGCLSAWLVFYMENFFKQSKLQGFSIFPSGALLYICSLANTGNHLWTIRLHCSLWWFLAVGESVPLSDSSSWMDHSISDFASWSFGRWLWQITPATSWLGGRLSWCPTNKMLDLYLGIWCSATGSEQILSLEICLLAVWGEDGKYSSSIFSVHTVNVSTWPFHCKRFVLTDRIFMLD